MGEGKASLSLGFHRIGRNHFLSTNQSSSLGLVVSQIDFAVPAKNVVVRVEQLLSQLEQDGEEEQEGSVENHVEDASVFVDVEAGSRSCNIGGSAVVKREETIGQRVGFVVDAMSQQLEGSNNHHQVVDEEGHSNYGHDHSGGGGTIVRVENKDANDQGSIHNKNSEDFIPHIVHNVAVVIDVEGHQQDKELSKATGGIMEGRVSVPSRTQRVICSKSISVVGTISDILRIWMDVRSSRHPQEEVRQEIDGEKEPEVSLVNVSGFLAQFQTFQNNQCPETKAAESDPE